MSIIPLIRPGTWWIKSGFDPRWNDSGDAYVGGLVRPRECDEAIERKKRELGEDPPEDLEWGYMKH